jgi:hypothetical protein
MTFAKNLLADLVDKKLWPVALLLVGALVAVPLLLGGAPAQSGETSAATDAPAADDTFAGPALATAESGLRDHRRRMGGAKPRDPFKAPGARGSGGAKDSAGKAVVKKGPAGGASGAGGAGGMTGKAAPTGAGASAGGSGGGGGSEPALGGGGDLGGSAIPIDDLLPGSGGERPARSHHILAVDLRFGEEGAPRTLRNLRRLAALPPKDDPVAIYMGLLRDRRTAVFLIDADATKHGEGSCKPDARTCTTVHVRKGQTVYLEVPSASRGSVQYRLELLRVVKRRTSSRAKAEDSYAREPGAARKLLHEAGEERDAQD